MKKPPKNDGGFLSTATHQTAGPAGIAGCYVLSLGTMVALETAHHGWAVLLGSGALGAAAASATALTITVRNAVRSVWTRRNP